MVKRTPTQELIVDVLLARHRLGENIYVIDTKNMKALSVLEEAGIIGVMHGNVENTVRAFLMPKYRKKWLEDSKYVSPLEKELAELKAENKALRKLAKEAL